MTTKIKRTTKRTPNGFETARILEWRFQEGPSRRSWRWYIGMLFVGLVLGGILLFIDRDGPRESLGAALWLCAVYAFGAHYPPMRLTGQLDGQVLYAWTVKRHRARIERNLAELATWRVDLIPGDRLNPELLRLIPQLRNGRGTTELILSEDPELVEQALERIAAVVPPAPNIAPTWTRRMFPWASGGGDNRYYAQQRGVTSLTLRDRRVVEAPRIAMAQRAGKVRQVVVDRTTG